MANDWEKVAENMVRHRPSGGLYLRAKVGGKVIRKSLGLKSVRPAKIKRDTMLAELRAKSGIVTDGEAVTVEHALTMMQAWFDGRQLKESTRLCKLQFLEVLRQTLPKSSPTVWTDGDMEKWWKDPAVSKYAAPRRNAILDTLRKMISMLIGDKKVDIQDDPTSELERIKVKSKIPAVPERKDFERVIKSIRDQKNRSSVDCANMVAFMAFSGCRISEARGVEWSHVGKDTIEITGGEDGTKNNESRTIPIIPPMRELLDSMIHDDAAGFLFSIKSPRFAIINACDRVKIDPFTPHTCRHLFATVCIESGVDIPTVARWLGHKDGGALAMRVYGHLRDEHSQTQAARVTFGG